MRKIIIPLALLAAMFLTACEVEEPGGKNLSQSNGPNVSTDTEAEPEKDDGPKLTSAQENAIDQANNYLDMSAFSRKGLIDQLKFEGFGPKVAAFAVDYINPDWNVQAAKKAKEYLEMSSFSKSGLVDQLKFEGFTDAQATHGANQAYR